MYKHCSVETCSNQSKVRGWCSKHYQRMYLRGSLNTTRIIGDDSKRFWSKVDKTDTCWLWEAAKLKGKYGGYGRFMMRGKIMLAHRFSYELINGKIPDTLKIDHLCRNPSCVNPRHLEAVTNRENTVRGRLVTDKLSELPVGVRIDKRGYIYATKDVDGRRTHLGIFKTVEEASIAYQLR